MPIQFRCTRCDTRLTISQRKAGAQTQCPKCGLTLNVPGDDDPPTELPEPIPTHATSSSPPVASDLEEPGPGRALRGFAIAGGVLALLSIGALLALPNRTPPAAPGVRDVVAAPMASAPAADAHPAVSSPRIAPAAAVASATEIVVRAPDRAPLAPPPHSWAPPQPERSTAAAAQTADAGAKAPSQTVVRPPAPPIAVDQFGNPISPSVGLGKENEFKGKKLLFWSGYERAGAVFFGPTNPLWKAWEQQGFTVKVQFGRFRTEWLRDIDQLWILSTGAFQVPLGVPPQMLVNAVDLLPAASIPSGFTAAEYKFIVAATLDMSLSPVHHLDETAYRAIIRFVQSGKGLCLLSDDEPFTIESNELARRLYGVNVKGNYIADQVAYVRNRGLTPADIRKFGGQYEVDDHPLLRGVNFLYEGITISNVGRSDKLETALKASDGQPLIAVSKVPDQRVVIDCAFTQLCHGPTERTSYILKSAGAVRLAQNIAAYLAGKEGVEP